MNQFDKVVHEKIGLDDEGFAELVGKQRLHNFQVMKDGESILYARTLSTKGSEKKPIITLIIVLNTDSIKALLNDTGMNNRGSAYMLMDQGTVFGSHTDGDSMDYAHLSTLHGLGRIAETDRIAAYADSKVTGFRYVLSVPYGTFLKDINSAQITFIICLAIMLLLGVLASYVLASMNYKPLHHLKQTAQILDKGQDDFTALRNKLSDLLNSEDKMHEEISQMNRIASVQLFHTLLMGNVKDLGRHQMEQLYSSFTGDVFVAAMIDMEVNAKGEHDTEDSCDTEALDVLLNKLTIDLCENVCEFIIRKENEAFAAVFCFAGGTHPNEAQFKVQEIAKALLERFAQHLHLSAYMYVGDARNGIGSVAQSYANAIKAKEYAAFIAQTEKQVVLFDETMFSSKISWRDFDIVDAERRFVNLMLEGNYAGGEQMLQEILAYYSCKDGMSLYVMRCRMFGVMNMMLNVLHEVEPDIDATFYEETNPVETLLSARTMKELSDALFHIIDHLIGRQENKTTDIKDKLIQVEHFVAARYFDGNLSVQQIADNFGLSLPYLSRVFKKEKGVGLLDYINRYRVKKAKKMMEMDENMTISDVAEKVGYNSSQTLIRIFKRYEGVTPGHFRNTAEDVTEDQPATLEE